MGDLVPVFIQETLPGDKFKVNLEHLIRFQPLLAPIMHRVNVYTHFSLYLIVLYGINGKTLLQVVEKVQIHLLSLK